jgi:hypothetical protein
MTAGAQRIGSSNLDAVSLHQISTIPSYGPENEIMALERSACRARLMRRMDLPPADFTRAVLPRQVYGFLTFGMSVPVLEVAALRPLFIQQLHCTTTPFARASRRIEWLTSKPRHKTTDQFAHIALGLGCRWIGAAHICPVDLRVKKFAAHFSELLDLWTVFRWYAVHQPLLHNLVPHAEGISERLQSREFGDCARKRIGWRWFFHVLILLEKLVHTRNFCIGTINSCVHT